MANHRAFLSLALTLLVISPSGTLAQIWGLPWFQTGQQSERLVRSKQVLNDCNIQQLSANEPTISHRSEAGITEIWDPKQQEFQCAGVTVVRHVVEPKGLHLPHYSNAPFIAYIVQGRGVMGVNLPGCPETFESFSEEAMRESNRKDHADRHQKVRRIREGDVIALPAGVSRWVYNDGETPLTCVSLYDTNNFQNQLDQNLRQFFLAGNPQSREGGRSRHEIMRRHERESEESEGNNVLSGFDEQLLADAFGVDQETIRSIKGQQDERGSIVRVERDLEFLSPEFDREEQEFRGRREEHDYRRHHHGGRREGERGRGWFDNGIEETLCSATLKHNLNIPREADVFNPHGGRLTSVNSNKLPILNYLQLSAEKVHLYQNAILTPNWKINAHTICYITRGQGRVQVANQEGRLVFDDEVREGQLLVVPQNFVVVKKAGQDGLEWVAFLTNDEAMMSPLAGRISAIRAMPDEVVMNSYGLSREEARQLKYSREEVAVFSPSSQSRSQRRGDEYPIV